MRWWWRWVLDWGEGIRRRLREEPQDPEELAYTCYMCYGRLEPEDRECPTCGREILND